MKVRIILQKDMPHLGVRGDVKEVSPGYARNYLLPQRMAVLATPRHVKTWEAEKDKLEQERGEKLATAREQAKKIDGALCQVHVRAGQDGKLFGSVTAADVAKAFLSQGVAIDRKWIEMREVIRTTGEFSGTARLHPQVRASFKVQVHPLA